MKFDTDCPPTDTALTRLRLVPAKVIDVPVLTDVVEDGETELTVVLGIVTVNEPEEVMVPPGQLIQTFPEVVPGETVAVT